MKVPIAYYLMILYVTVMFKPLIPIVTDSISHVFYKAIHIATVHALYGSNHLQKELADSSSESATDKHQSNTTGDQVPVHVPAIDYSDEFSLHRMDKHYSFLKLYKLLPGFMLNNFPPPRLS
jgi:hypothetical protein